MPLKTRQKHQLFESSSMSSIWRGKTGRDAQHATPILFGVGAYCGLALSQYQGEQGLRKSSWLEAWYYRKGDPQRRRQCQLQWRYICSHEISVSHASFLRRVIVAGEATKRRREG